MNMIVVYRPDGTPFLGTDASGDPRPLPVDDDSQRTAELMGDDVLTLRFSLAESVAFPLRSWCEFEGGRYYLYKSPEITKRHNRHYDYVMPMYTSAYLLKTTLMRNRTYDRRTGVYGGDLRLKFPLTATPREHLEMIAACLNYAETEPAAVWAVDYSKTMGMTAATNGAHANYDGTKWNDEGDEALVSYEFNHCIDAIRAVATTFGREYEVADAAVAGAATVCHLLSLHDVEYNKDRPLLMSYGKGNGFKSGIARKNEGDLPPIDLLYIQGGEQNIPPHYGRTPTGLDAGSGAMGYDGDGSPTLLLPRTLTNLSGGAPTPSSVYRGVACFHHSGGGFYFSTDPTVLTDGDGNRYVKAKDLHEAGTGLPIYEVLYDESGDGLGATPLMIPTPCYLVSDDGRSVERVRHTYYDPGYSPRGTKVESFYDASEVYPMRVGGVSAVKTTTRTRQVDDGNGGTTTETYKLYDIIDATGCPDYSRCSVPGETMTVIFQDGMLAGREFDLNTTEGGAVICADATVYDADNNPLPAKRLELCPSDQDGLTMPNETFKPRPGDHYIVFHCSLPKEYIGSSVADGDGRYDGARGMAYGAEFRALKEMVSYLGSHGKETYTFSGGVDGVWARRVWDEEVPYYVGSHVTYGSYFAIGQHIKVSDVALFGAGGLVMRVTGIRQPVNYPRSMELALTNAVALKYNWASQLAKTVEEVRLRPRHIRPGAIFFPKTSATASKMLLSFDDATDLRGVSVVSHGTFSALRQTVVADGARISAALEDDNSIRADAIRDGVITAKKLDSGVLSPLLDGMSELNAKVDGMDGTIMNLDRMAPQEKPYDKATAVGYVANVARPERKANAVILFNDGGGPRFYCYGGADDLNFDNPDYWREVAGGPGGGSVLYYPSLSSFPPIGEEDTTYVDKQANRQYLWSAGETIYVPVGMKAGDIETIDANF